MEVEENEAEPTTPFWIQPSTTSSRSRLSTGLLIFVATVFLFILLFTVVSKPNTNTLKKSYESLHIALILLALLFGFLSRDRNHDPAIGSNDLMERKIRNEIGNGVRYEYSDQTESNEVQYNYSDRTDTNEVRYNYSDRTASNKVWYEYSEGTRSRIKKDVGYDYSDQTTSKMVNDEIYASEVQAEGISETRKNVYAPKEQAEEILETRKNVYKPENPSWVEKFEGEVKIVNNGIAHIYGLNEVTVGEIVEFEEGTIGIVRNSEKMEESDIVIVVLMGEGLRIQEGTRVKATGKIVDVPGGAASSGHIDDTKGEKSASETIQAPPSVRRRKRRTAGGVANKRRSSEEGSSLEPTRQHRKGKMRDLERFGTVLRVCEGIARIDGLDDVSAGEVVEFDEGIIGIAFDSGFANNVGVVLMGDSSLIREGSRVKATGEIAQIPVGKASLGRIISTLAKPIEVEREISASQLRTAEETEIKQVPVRRRTRRAAGSTTNNENSSKEMNGLEASGHTSHRETKRGHEREISASEEAEIKKMAAAIRQSNLNNEKSSKEMNGLEASGHTSHRDTKRGHEREISASEEAEIKKMAAVIHQSNMNNEKPSKEMYGLEASEKLSHRMTKRTQEESVILKEDVQDELESKIYESSPTKLAQDVLSSPRKSEDENATRDLLASSRKGKEKQRQKSIESFETLLESQPPSPPTATQSFFSSKKGKESKIFVTVPPPPLPPHLATARRPPVSGAESSLHSIPSPPPLPPFKMPGWKFMVNGDYVQVASVCSSRSVSPERDEVDSSMSSRVDGGDVSRGSMFCPSPDVNSKADMFIANFRAGLKLQKMNSIKQNQGVGLSNLRPPSKPISGSTLSRD